MSQSKLLNLSNSILVIVDVQEAFRSVIPDFASIASRIAMAVRGFQVLEVPILVTEQYSKGLGRTAEEIRLTLPDDFEVIEKSTFSSCGGAFFAEKLADRAQIVLCGIETHICVNQTAHDLLDRGFNVHLFTDCVASRFDHDKQAGLDKMFSAGVTPSSVEMSLFELMRDSKHEKFREIQSIIR